MEMKIDENSIDLFPIIATIIIVAVIAVVVIIL